MPKLGFQHAIFTFIAVDLNLKPIKGGDTFVEWSQTGYKDDSPGTLRFYSASGLGGMTLILTKRGGLYYTQTDVYTHKELDSDYTREA